MTQINDMSSVFKYSAAIKTISGGNLIVHFDDLIKFGEAISTSEEEILFIEIINNFPGGISN